MTTATFGIDPTLSAEPTKKETVGERMMAHVPTMRLSLRAVE